ncbi:hypothetical protein [Nocardia sp. 852002-51244_SCH5132740]|uniref:hypothetical protein n=1 Tax=Nocardia sp. 852002-51244_SCH5132740 TaxID=1834099 RepID=UPI0007EAFD90|nr:hypothetical protein [Nocardia sp. 852002-51244_SCH5132740]OBB51761.1 hypothetical protein A5748_16430 [Nocardia sp. 852002-51244_SCH5132740]
MTIPDTWSRAIWRRAAAPAIPSVLVTGGHMTSDGTLHHADYVGADRWVVDYLPGRQLTREQATAAMRIAIAPERLEVERWAGQLGLTAAEARGFVELPVGVA